MSRNFLNSLRSYFRGGERFVDMRGVTDDPFVGEQLAGRRPYLLEVELSHWRLPVPMGLRCTEQADNPLVETFRLYRAGKCGDYANSPMHDYYANCQPRSMAEALGLKDACPTSLLREMPASVPLLPWWRVKLAKLKTMEQQRLRRYAVRSAGARSDPLKGVMYWGPVSNSFGDEEFARIAGICDSIGAVGFQLSEHDHLRTHLLVRDGAYCLLPSSGKHRLVALAALNYAKVPVVLGSSKLCKRIDRSDVDQWPHVRSGLFRRCEALAVFDRIFDGLAAL